MQSLTSVKIPKKSESAFPNKENFTLIFDLTPGCPRMCSEAIFVFNQIVDRCSAATSRVGEGTVGGPATELRGVSSYFNISTRWLMLCRPGVVGAL
jgi:hypothetical protein